MTSTENTTDVRIIRTDITEPEHLVIADGRQPYAVLVPMDFTDEQAAETAQRLQDRYKRVMAAYERADEARAAVAAGPGALAMVFARVPAGMSEAEAEVRLRAAVEDSLGENR